MITKRLTGGVAAAAVLGAIAAAQEPQAPTGGARNLDWPVYRGDPKGNQYSPRAEIDGRQYLAIAAGGSGKNRKSESPGRVTLTRNLQGSALRVAPQARHRGLLHYEAVTAG